jgi:spore cortex formation protein SpoVR/YcgB (stage V sporulation)
MKRKKLYEAEVEKIQNVKMTLETQCINLESAAQNVETFKAMKTGGETMKKIQTEVGVEKVEEIMDDIKDVMDQAMEINNAMAQQIDPLMTDDDELLAELNALEAADLEQQLTAPPTKTAGLSLPTVPDTKLPKLNKKEEDDLKALEAELAGL